MKKLQPFVGVAYYPEAWDRSEMIKDLDNMVRYGIKAVRVAEFAWKTMEPEDGEFDFSLFREMTDECNKRGIYVIFGTPGACPPRWLAEKYPDIYVKHYDGSPNGIGARRDCCFNNEHYKFYTDRITERMAKEFGSDENVIGWQIDNEIDARKADIGCVCPDCVKTFQDWCRKRFGGDIEAFNKQIDTGVFSTKYDDFSQLEAPRFKQWTSPALKALWLQCKHDTAIEYIVRQREIIKKYSDKPVGTDTMPTCHALSYEGVGKTMDIMQFNQYSYGARYAKVETWFNFMYNIKKKPFWLTETSTCWNGDMRSNYMRAHGFVEMNGWLALMNGAESVNYWLWRTHYGSHELMHGSVIESNGRDRHMAKEVMKFTSDIKKNADIISDTAPKDSGLAIMCSCQSETEFYCQSMYELNGKKFDYRDLISKYVELPLMRARLMPAIISATTDFQDKKVLLTPFITCLENDNLSERILLWVKEGGTWITGPLTDIRTAAHSKYTESATGITEKAADVTVQFTTPAFDPNDPAYVEIGLNYSGASVKAEQLCFDAIMPGKTAETLMTYENESYFDGYSAVTQTQYGKGKIVVLGCLPAESALVALTKNLCAEKNILPVCEASHNLSVIERTGKAGTVYAVIETEYKKGLFVCPCKVHDRLSGKDYEEGENAEVAPYQVMLLEKI